MEFNIVGSGIAGLVAAIDLKLNDVNHTVIIHEKRYNILDAFPVSSHMTRVNVGDLNNFLGYDVSSFFVPSPLYVDFLRKSINIPGYYAVERGYGKTSLDGFLYEKAKRFGVEFNFASEVRNFSGWENVIFNAGFDSLGGDNITLHVYHGTGNDDMTRAGVFWGSFSPGEYGYYSSVNGICSAAHFSRQKIGEKHNELFKKTLREHGFPDLTYEYHVFRVPKQCVLAERGLVMVGTGAGAIDKRSFYGINAAIISGRLGAMYYYDKERAVVLFNELIKKKVDKSLHKGRESTFSKSLAKHVPSRVLAWHVSRGMYNNIPQPPKT